MTTTEDTTAVHALLHRSAAAWAAGDGAAYGACFTEDATDVTYVAPSTRAAPRSGAPIRPCSTASSRGPGSTST
ncbi:hypothetical protein [Streptomyces sp. NBC_00523]|uniref:hypothetical protein n=1 Tax=unclassified Streptomyces TaxID=2593676 RepID=UPI002E81AF23|nr:hypothetical protein [Streptomyces sp. NBC_00523]WUD04565.1 hypothetical protein OHS17_33145 [Streptomyces sp. NBC_00523]